MSNPEQNVTVRHNEAESRFEAIVDGEVCVADYQKRGEEMAFTHTYVPPALRGRGIAEKIVRAGLEYARDHKFRVVPACWYVDTYIQRNPEFAGLVR